MDITYLGHSAFKLRGKRASVVTDPYPNSVGFGMPKSSADIVTVSHYQHDDHSAVSQVTGTSRRDKPYEIGAPGEYEVSDVGVFGWGCFHDDKKGAERGKNTAYVIHIDGIRVAHLGDLGHELSDDLLKNIGEVDVVLVPVGGVYTIGPAMAKKVIESLNPSYAIPMHFRTDAHNQETFGALHTVEDFLTEMGVDQPEQTDKLSITSGELPEDTQVVVLQK